MGKNDVTGFADGTDAVTGLDNLFIYPRKKIFTLFKNFWIRTIRHLVIFTCFFIIYYSLYNSLENSIIGL